jgi:predicted SAM-dependent methyltransferase
MKKFISPNLRVKLQPIKPIKLEIETILGKMTRQIIRPDLPRLEDGSVNVHLGCGYVNHPAFVNIDGLPLSHVHYIRPIDNLSCFKDNSVDLIYACHCLEHFSHTKVYTVLFEWFRVLKIGSILRLSVPDFDLLINIYRENSNNINTILYPLMGGQDYKFNFHLTVFNHDNLRDLLKQVGFKEVRVWQPGSSPLTTFDDWSGRKMIINGKEYDLNLNIEAVK